MSMTPRERIMAVLNGEEPDKTPVGVINLLLGELGGGWCRRLQERGLAIFNWTYFYTPNGVLGARSEKPALPDVKYTLIHYLEKGLRKCRYVFDTPVGSVTGIMMSNPLPNAVLVDAPAEYPVKKPSDWRVINYLLKGVLARLAPAYAAVERADDEVGDGGIVVAVAEYTAWQKAWTHFASPERVVIDFHERAEEVQEYIDIHTRIHARIAEFAAGCPAKFIDIGENMTDTTSPRYYREYGLPIYKNYAKQLEGTGKVLGIHMDGRLGSLKKVIAETPCNVIESFAVPPTGDISLAEVRKIWPDKMIFMNTASHLAWAKPDEVRKFYETLAQEWGSKKGLILELSEDLPLQTVEAHMSAAMDAFGY